MSSGIEFSPQIWNWYVGFFISMGAVLAVAFAFTFAVLTIHWLYFCAGQIDSKPTPSSLYQVFFNLSGFQAIVIGVSLVPVGTIAIYYLLFSLIWKLAPSMVEAPPLDIGSIGNDEWFSSMASLITYLIVLTTIIAGIIFILLRNYANKIVADESLRGFSKRFLRRYFHDNRLVGVLLILIAYPVLLYFLYNMACLVMVIVPSMRLELPRLAFPKAEILYLSGLRFVGYWILVVLFIPAVGLLLRGMLLRWRYTIENPALKIIFIRSVKFSIIVFLGWVGVVCMYFLAHESFNIILKVTH